MSTALFVVLSVVVAVVSFVLLFLLLSFASGGIGLSLPALLASIGAGVLLVGFMSLTQNSLLSHKVNSDITRSQSTQQSQK
jgi:uncharacterized membrane protein required for colicin V production